MEISRGVCDGLYHKGSWQGFCLARRTSADRLCGVLVCTYAERLPMRVIGVAAAVLLAAYLADQTFSQGRYTYEVQRMIVQIPAFVWNLRPPQLAASFICGIR
jgi:hypothetical protein